MKASKGKVASGTASPAKGTNRKPMGMDGKSAHPMMSGKGNKKMSRVLKGVDKKKQKKGVNVGDKRNKLEGKYF